MHFRKNELNRKIKWACELHAAEMELPSRKSAMPKIIKRAGGLFTASVLYLAIVAMWVAIALRLF